MIKKFLTDLPMNLLQILVVLILIPIVFLILSLLKGFPEGLSFLLDVMGEIQIFDVLMEFISTCLRAYDPVAMGNPDYYLDAITRVLDTMSGSMVQIFCISLCVRCCNLFCDIVRWPGVRILPSIFGVICGYCVAAIYGPNIFVLSFLFLLIVVVDMVFLFGRRAFMMDLFLKYILVCLKTSVEMLAIVFMTGFITIILVIWQGGVTSIPMVLFLIAMFAIPWFALLAVNRYLIPE